MSEPLKPLESDDFQYTKDAIKKGILEGMSAPKHILSGPCGYATLTGTYVLYDCYPLFRELDDLRMRSQMYLAFIQILLPDWMDNRAAVAQGLLAGYEEFLKSILRIKL